MPLRENTARTEPDRCPGVLAVHQAADGGLARVRLPGGVLTSTQLGTLAAISADLGDGSLELTSRANLQLRGLGPDAPQELSDRLYGIGLLPSISHERVRNILASPLSGLDSHSRYDVLPAAAELDRRLCARPDLAGLPGRFLFALDDGRGDVAALGADVGIQVLPGHQAALLLAGADTGVRVSLDGPRSPDGLPLDADSLDAGPGDTESVDAGPGDTHPGEAGRAAAVDLMLAAAEAFLMERAAQQSEAWRVAELLDGPRRILERIQATRPGLRAGAAPIPPPSADPNPSPESALSLERATLPASNTTSGAVTDTASGPTSGTVSGPMSGTARAPRRDTASERVIGTAGVPIQPGRYRQPDGHTALVVTVPLGSIGPESAAALVATADAGAGRLRLTPWRSVVLEGLAEDVVDHSVERLAAVGLSADPTSAWAGVTACAGRPGCAKALADVRADARTSLNATPGVPGSAASQRAVHWSGCERRCGRPAGDFVDVLARENGYLVDGSVASEEDLADAVARQRTRKQ